MTEQTSTSTRYGSGYDGELSYVDRLIGRFAGYLKSKNLFDKSLIILLSDHGESLGDHGESTHGYFIYQSTIWVSLIIHWPNGRALLPTRMVEPVGLIAQAEFERAIALQPNFPGAHYNLGLGVPTKGRYCRSPQSFSKNVGARS